MANNRMYLVHNPTGQKIMLAKHMGSAWYTTDRELADFLDQWFDDIYDVSMCDSLDPDDFVVELEIPVSGEYR